VFSRNGHDSTERFPSIAQLVNELPAKAAVLDGEVVASDADGLPNFARRVTEERGLEGVVNTRRDAPYRSGDCPDLAQVKTLA
jgi:bifunctional non-homologous end joining protein LigD